MSSRKAIKTSGWLCHYEWKLITPNKEPIGGEREREREGGREGGREREREREERCKVREKDSKGKEQKIHVHYTSYTLRPSCIHILLFIIIDSIV